MYLPFQCDIFYPEMVLSPWRVPNRRTGLAKCLETKQADESKLLIKFSICGTVCLKSWTFFTWQSELFKTNCECESVKVNVSSFPFLDVSHPAWVPTSPKISPFLVPLLFSNFQFNHVSQNESSRKIQKQMHRGSLKEAAKIVWKIKFWSSLSLSWHMWLIYDSGRACRLQNPCTSSYLTSFNIQLSYILNSCPENEIVLFYFSCCKKAYIFSIFLSLLECTYSDKLERMCSYSLL